MSQWMFVSTNGLFSSFVSMDCIFFISMDLNHFLVSMDLKQFSCLNEFEAIFSSQWISRLNDLVYFLVSMGLKTFSRLNGFKWNFLSQRIVQSFCLNCIHHILCISEIHEVARSPMITSCIAHSQQLDNSQARKKDFEPSLGFQTRSIRVFHGFFRV